MEIAVAETGLAQCRTRAITYWSSLRHDEDRCTFWRASAAHDAARDPNLLILGTWAAVHGLTLAGHGFDPATRLRIEQGLSQFRGDDGYYGLERRSADSPNTPPAESPEYLKEYWRYHITNYAWGATLAIAPQSSVEAPFVTPLNSPEGLLQWLAARDWTNPWKEGNNIVNLASFYAILAERGCTESAARLQELADWHDANQQPTTGFWHLREPRTREQLVSIMAGAAHNLHLYYYLGREVPRFNQIIDSCLKIGYLGLRIACIDIDLVDILVHFRRYGYRLTEIDSVLARYLVELLQVQHRDGGFVNGFILPDVQFGRHTAAGSSVSWATWFRLATLGMAACALLPSERDKWHFRTTMGMGYCNLEFALGGAASESASSLAEVRPGWLAVCRETRWARQRVTRWLRQRLRPTSGRAAQTCATAGGAAS